MSAWKIILIVILVLLLLIVGLTIFFMYVVADSNRIKTGIEEHLRAVTGREFTIGHIRVRPAFPKLLSLSVQGLQVKGADEAPFVSADEIVFIPSLLPLFSGEISIDSIKLYGLRAKLQKREDGSLTDMIIPVPVASPAPQESKTETTPTQTQHNSSSEKRRLQWSIDSVDLIDAEVQFVDQNFSPDKPLVFKTTMDGQMSRSKGSEAFSFDIHGKIADADNHSAPYKATGNIYLAPDLNSVRKADAKLDTQGLPVRLFSPYLGPKGRYAEKFSGVNSTIDVSYEKGKDSGAGINAAAFTSQGSPANATAEIQLSLDENFRQLKNAKGVINLLSVPLSMFDEMARPKLPALKLEKGAISGKIEGVWKNSDDWNADATLEANNIMLAPVLSKLSSNLNLNTKFTINPSLLDIERLELGNEKNRLLVLGQVTNPLDESKQGDLKLEVSLLPEFLQAMGPPMPRELRFKGQILIKGTIKGKPESLRLDLNSNLKNADIAWNHDFHKASGVPGRLAVETTYDALKSKIVDPTALDLDFPSAVLTIKGKRLETGISLKTKVDHKGKFLDLRGAVVELGRDKEIIGFAKGNFTNVGSTSPDFEGNFSVVINKNTLSIMEPLPSDILIEGSSRITGKFSGEPQRFTFSAEAPLNNIALGMGKEFKKPAGVAGSLKANGKFNRGSIELSDGVLTLPGLLVIAKGTVTDKSGSFANVALDIKKADLKELAKFAPELASLKPSGQLSGHVLLKNQNGDLLHYGSIKLHGLELKPAKSGIIFHQVKGVIEPSGLDAKIPELSGRITGAVESPFKVKGKLENLHQIRAISGKIDLDGGPGRLKSERLRSVLQNANLIANVLRAKPDARNPDLLEFESLTGEFNIKRGVVHTEDLRFKGAALNAGVVGNMDLQNSELDAVMGLKTATHLGNILSKAPGVQKLLKKNEGLLKATGLDKELKRWGILGGKEADKEGSTDKAPAVNKPTTLTLFVKLRGSAASPEVVPILESQGSSATMAKLKGLIAE